MSRYTSCIGTGPRVIVSSAIFAIMACSSLCAGQSAGTQQADPATLQALLDRVNRLEARLQQLEAAQQGAAVSCQPAIPPTVRRRPESLVESMPTLRAPEATAPDALVAAGAAAAAPQPQAEVEQSQAESAMAEQMDVSKTLLRIRGFGDVSLHGDTQHGDTTTFSLGQLDLFVTSDISEKFRFLSEIVFEGSQDNIYGAIVGPENQFSIDVERYLLQYSLNDYLRLSVGRGHTAIGYYNTAYHHSTWMQTTVDRPFLFEFEDRGGILPVHTVGATASGLVPSGALGLHYVAEIGNGRESRNPLQDDPVQSVVSDSNGKAFNLALFARPEAMRGFQTGVSVYRDTLTPAALPKIGETIVAAHAILIRPKYEWLNEAVVDRHAPQRSPVVFHTTGFYSQVSRQFGPYRPYFRYEYLNAPPNEPVFPDIALMHGPLVGVRFDANESVALKFQYQYTMLRNQPSVSELTGQLGFTF